MNPRARDWLILQIEPCGLSKDRLTTVGGIRHAGDSLGVYNLKRLTARRCAGSGAELNVVGQEYSGEPTEKAYPWFALRVRSNHERVAATHLRGKGYEEFAPSYKTERQWSDRRKTTEQFLFPGYVFCRLDPG